MPKGYYGTRNWTEEQDEYLRENWGRVSEKTIARVVGRSVIACQIRAKRGLNISRKMNIYTARMVAKIFGVDDHTVIRWLREGHLKGKKSATRVGKNRAWDIDDESIERFIKKTPWLFDRKRIHRVDYSYWRDQADAAWTKNPCVTIEEAAERLGGLHVETIRRHVRRGWLQAYRVHWLGNDAGSWLVPVAALETFRFRRPPILALGCVADANRRRTHEVVS